MSCCDWLLMHLYPSDQVVVRISATVWDVSMVMFPTVYGVEGGGEGTNSNLYPHTTSTLLLVRVSHNRDL
jgi:hypothetical protein